MYIHEMPTMRLVIMGNRVSSQKRLYIKDGLSSNFLFLWWPYLDSASMHSAAIDSMGASPGCLSLRDGSGSPASAITLSLNTDKHSQTKKQNQKMIWVSFGEHWKDFHKIKHVKKWLHRMRSSKDSDGNSATRVTSYGFKRKLKMPSGGARVLRVKMRLCRGSAPNFTAFDQTVLGQAGLLRLTQKFKG